MCESVSLDNVAVVQCLLVFISCVVICVAYLPFCRSSCVGAIRPVLRSTAGCFKEFAGVFLTSFIEMKMILRYAFAPLGVF